MPIRPATAADAATCGHLIYEAFLGVAREHNVPPDWTTARAAVWSATALIGQEGVRGLVAERDGSAIACGFVDLRATIAGVGPIAVSPGAQDAAAGQRLVAAIMTIAEDAGAAGTRLVQAAFNGRSLNLYTRLGFRVREPLLVMQGPALGLSREGFAVRIATADDATACNSLARRLHGFARERELAERIAQGVARVVEHRGRITGYATDIGFNAHAVAENNDGLKALIGAAAGFNGPGFLLPARNHELLAWCLEKKLRVVWPATLMTLGLYSDPDGAYLPSILF